MRLSDFLCKAMGWMMCISIPFFVYHLAGGSLPHQFAYNEKLQYTFDNFYFFMINDSNERIIPRFHAFFLEPGHVGTACTFLLLTQIGRWKRWYNIVLAFTSIITLSHSNTGASIWNIPNNNCSRSAWPMGGHFLWLLCSRRTHLDQLLF